MQNLKNKLKNRLKGATRIAVLGIGSELRGDDSAGLLAARELNDNFRDKPGAPKLKVFLAGTAPENLTGEVKKFQPTHLVVIDAADIKREPGAISLLEPQEIGGAGFSTHMLPITITLDYLCGSLACNVSIIGIQPKSVNFGDPVSEEVLHSAKSVSKAILEALTS